MAQQRARAHAAQGASKDSNDEQSVSDLRELSFLKNNYGPLADSLTLRWDNGVYVPQGGPGTFERAAAEANAENLFLKLLARFNAQSRNANDKTGPTYAPALFAEEPEAKTARIKAPALADAMRRLFAAGRIHLEPYGKGSRHQRLVLGPHPARENAAG